MVQVSSLSATTTNKMPTTTQGRLDLIFESFRSICQKYKLITEEPKKFETLTAQIKDLREGIINILEYDKSIVNQPNTLDENQSETITMYAAFLGFKDIIKTLSNRNKFFINAQDKFKNTTFIWAVRNNKHNIMRLLLNCKADITIKNYKGNAALDIAEHNLTYLNNHPYYDKKTNAVVESPHIEATKETIRILKEALQNKANNPSLRKNPNTPSPSPSNFELESNDLNKKTTSHKLESNKDSGDKNQTKVSKIDLDRTNESSNINPNFKKKSTNPTDNVLEHARIKRAFWVLVAVFLLALTGWGIHHWISESRTDANVAW